jgi:hypothetical protein
MAPPFAHRSNCKDLQDLRNLSRAPILSYLQKQTLPPAPRIKTTTLAPARYPILAAFSPKRLCKWIWEYLSQRIGPRHPFQIYPKSDSDQGIYELEGDKKKIRIALAGDWVTGTDEAERVGELIKKFDPHYSIHLGDVYYVGGPIELDENQIAQIRSAAMSSGGRGDRRCRTMLMSASPGRGGAKVRSAASAALTGIAAPTRARGARRAIDDVGGRRRGASHGVIDNRSENLQP